MLLYIHQFPKLFLKWCGNWYLCNTFTVSKHFQNFIWFSQPPYEVGVVSFIFRLLKIQLTVAIKRGKQNLYQGFTTLKSIDGFSTGQHFRKCFPVVNTVTSSFNPRLLYINKTFTESQLYSALCMANQDINNGLYFMFLSSSDVFHLDNLRYSPKSKLLSSTNPKNYHS